MERNGSGVGRAPIGALMRSAAATAAVLLAVGAAGAASASAATVTKSSSFADPAATLSNTVLAGGALQLAPSTFSDPFDGTSLAANWHVTLDDATAGSSATSAGGSLHVDGAAVVDDHAVAPGDDVQFTATLGNAAFTSVGLAANLDPGPFAAFSTGPDGAAVYVTSNDGLSTSSPQRLTPTIDPTTPHVFRIDWTTTGFAFFVDGRPVAVTGPPLTAAASLHVIANDLHHNDLVPGPGSVAVASTLSVDSATLRTGSEGTFESAPIDAGDPRVTAAALAPQSTTPPGTDIRYATRSAATPGGLASATYVPVGPDGTVQSPAARFLQYRATLATTDLTLTPTLAAVDAVFTVGPAVRLDVQVDGTTATAAFTSGDPTDAVGCKLDDAPSFAPCTSPARYEGLSVGSHTLAVRATDTIGRVDTATTTFAVAAPAVTDSDPGVPAPGSDTPGPPAGSQPPAVPPSQSPRSTPVPKKDVTAPKVTVQARSLRISKHGALQLKLTCPRTETRCTFGVTLTATGKKVARGTATVTRGQTKTLTLTLSKAARAKLAARSRLKVSATILAKDQAGNRRTTKLALTLRRPAR